MILWTPGAEPTEDLLGVLVLDILRAIRDALRRR